MDVFLKPRHCAFIFLSVFGSDQKPRCLILVGPLSHSLARRTAVTVVFGRRRREDASKAQAAREDVSSCGARR